MWPNLKSTTGTSFDHSIETVAQVERVLDLRELATEEPGLRSIPRFDGMDAYFAEQIGDGTGIGWPCSSSHVSLHDVAKPETRTVEPSGRVRFLGHDKLGAEDRRPYSRETPPQPPRR